ncbi:class I SAM-dependent methyltransferase [Siccirubricoccus sp. KC 17139]|uniref:Class I SAM-dependent methyltransferase n=1 Tax=Siccirubricoccus soli TaxID=2899147 RepID=A0ABT1D9Q3_9PROT|nr:class I SAM-dependent methyltransferase [Siccirubricoccus soli]MCO6418594.1 class I SAM-dependent methyltransferase [Siccirubricoccus soli]MCP2684729.1 class I SAM-dependent methyltransferase [Siccirubricoccus soli]
MQKYSKAERYTAFLAAYLPRLTAVTGVCYGEDTSRRGLPLLAALARATTPGICLEFGVYKGSSINYCAAQYPNRRFYGFDSFQGFPDDGRNDWKQDFSTHGVLPKVRENVTLIPGFFSDTLPNFLSEQADPVAFVNIDCDIYSSTADVFVALRKAGMLKPGLPISFDELINYKSFLWNEMLALFEMLEQTGLGIAWVCAHQRIRLVDETLFLLQSGAYPSWEDDLRTGFRQQASLVLTDQGLDLSILSLPHAEQRIKQMAKTLMELTRQHSPASLNALQD